MRDDQDRSKMVDTLRRYSDELDVEIVSYCLMDNHIHLLLRTKEDAALFIKKLASSYVYYFNHKYDRIGHLFQDRYKSEPVETEEYLLTVARYILQNPDKAGICAADQYEWSNWREVETGHGFCNTQLLCDCIGDRQALTAFCRATCDDKCMDTGEKKILKDSDALLALRKICGTQETSKVARLPKSERDLILRKAKRAGLSVRQISRLTGVDRNTVQRA